MRVVVDTCIIIDVLQKREPFFHNSFEIFKAVAGGRIEGCIIAKELCDVYCFARKSVHSTGKVKDIINKLLELFVLIDTGSDDCMNALAADMKDFEDAVMSMTAKRIGADFIVTRNIKDYKSSPVQAVLPESLKFV